MEIFGHKRLFVDHADSKFSLSGPFGDLLGTLPILGSTLGIRSRDLIYVVTCHPYFPMYTISIHLYYFQQSPGSLIHHHSAPAPVILYGRMVSVPAWMSGTVRMWRVERKGSARVGTLATIVCIAYFLARHPTALVTMNILTVFGATGNQGGSVIRAVLSHPSLRDTWTIRAVTRDASKPSAQQLASHARVDVVTADMDRPEQVAQAIQGSTAVFGVTNFWERMSKEVEVAHGRAIVDGATQAKVARLLFSSLPHVQRLTNGTLQHVDHFDGKAEIEEYAEQAKRTTGMRTTFVQAGFYMSNLENFINEQNGHWVLAAPLGDGDKTQIPMVDIEADYGQYVAGALEADAASLDGKHIHAVSQWITPNATVATAAKQMGKQVQYVDLDADTFASFMPNETVGTELKENMLLIRDYSYYGNDAPQNQAHHDQILPSGTKKATLQDYLSMRSKWKNV